MIYKTLHRKVKNEEHEPHLILLVLILYTGPLMSCGGAGQIFLCKSYSVLLCLLEQLGTCERIIVV
jgi:hypothetical protein